MKTKYQITFALIFFYVVECSSQENLFWDYKGKYYVSKIDSSEYLLKYFHHKVELYIDTLHIVNDSIYAGKDYNLFFIGKQMYVKPKKINKKMRLEISTKEFVDRMKSREEYFFRNIR